MRNEDEMKKQDYHTVMIAGITPEEAFARITRVADWWAKHFEGEAKKTGDVFTVRFGPKGEKDMYKIRVSEAIPGKRIAWEVIDSKQDWVKRPNEWTGTEIIWEISPEKEGARITMTHKGLNPALECYGKCVGGWTYLTSESLSKLLQENIGKPV